MFFLQEQLLQFVTLPSAFLFACPSDRREESVDVAVELYAACKAYVIKSESPKRPIMPLLFLSSHHRSLLRREDKLEGRRWLGFLGFKPLSLL